MTPPSPQRDTTELELLMVTTSMIIATLGYASPDLAETNARAEALAEKTGNLGHLAEQIYASFWAAVIAGTILPAWPWPIDYSTLAPYRAVGSLFLVPVFLTFLTEAQALGGALAESLQTIEEALTVNPDERFWRPETLRLRGEIRHVAGKEQDTCTPQGGVLGEVQCSACAVAPAHKGCFSNWRWSITARTSDAINS
jgi:hypothetical protein